MPAYGIYAGAALGHRAAISIGDEPALRRRRAAGRGVPARLRRRPVRPAARRRALASACATSARSRAKRSWSTQIARDVEETRAAHGRLTLQDRKDRASSASRASYRHGGKCDGPSLAARERPLSRVRRGLREACARRHRATNPGCPRAATSAGSRSTAAQATELPRRSAAGPPLHRSARRADAAEVVVARRPAAHRASAASSAASPSSSTPGSAFTSAPAGWTRGRSTAACGVEALVEDRARRRRRAPCAAACRPRRRSRARARRRRARASAPSCSPSARPGSSGAADEVGLAEHAVQVQVEAGEPVARAEAEARREHAGVAVARRRVTRFVVCASGRPRASSVATSAPTSACRAGGSCASARAHRRARRA